MQEVFEDHLQKRREGKVEEDIATNYAENVVLLTRTGIYQSLQYYLPDGTYEYRTKLVHGDHAFLEWHGYSDDGIIKDGADAFVIKNGKIIALSTIQCITIQVILSLR